MNDNSIKTVGKMLRAREAIIVIMAIIIVVLGSHKPTASECIHSFSGEIR